MCDLLHVLQKIEPRKVSECAKRLISSQLAVFPTILDDMKKEGLEEWRKKSHWAWYAFPTTLIGNNDDEETAVKNIEDALFVLENEETRKLWTNILINITESIKLQKTKKVIPRIDYGRIKFFIHDWSNVYSSITIKFPEFHQALHDFSKTWKSPIDQI